MGTFLFQQFPRLAFTSQWPIQQQVMPWHIQMGPFLKGRADTGWIMKHSTETNHSRQDDLRRNTGTRCGTCTGTRVWPGGSLDPGYQRLQSRLLLMSCKSFKTEQIKTRQTNLKMFPFISVLQGDFLAQCQLELREADPAIPMNWRIPPISQHKWKGLGSWKMKLWLRWQWQYPPFLFAAFTEGKEKGGRGLIGKNSFHQSLFYLCTIFRELNAVLPKF